MPKVTMLCKWPLIYVWILAVPLFYSLEYWLLGLEIPYRDLPLQEFFIWDLSLFSDERHQQLAVVHRHSLNQIRKTLNSPCFPHFVCQIQFTSTSSGTAKQQKRGWGEICSEGYFRGRTWKKRCSNKLSLDQGECSADVLRVSKEVICQLGLCLTERLFCTENSRQFITHRDSDACISCEWTLHFCS